MITIFSKLLFDNLDDNNFQAALVATGIFLGVVLLCLIIYLTKRHKLQKQYKQDAELAKKIAGNIQDKVDELDKQIESLEKEEITKFNNGDEKENKKQ